MPPIISHKRRILQALSECRSLFRHCLAPRGLHSDSGIEAAFLQMFRSWESFLEDSIASFMCSRLRCDQLVVIPLVQCRCEDDAKRFLHMGKGYVEWANVDETKERLNALFGDTNLLTTAVSSANADLNHMRTVRNIIAHSSVASRNKFDRLVQSKYGGHRSLPRAANFLSDSVAIQDAAYTYFDHYSDVLETVANQITG